MALKSEKTALAGQVRREINCRPVENLEYRQLMDERTRKAIQSKPSTQILSNDSLLQPFTLGTPGSFNTFIVRVALSVHRYLL